MKGLYLVWYRSYSRCGQKSYSKFFLSFQSVKSCQYKRLIQTAIVSSKKTNIVYMKNTQFCSYVLKAWERRLNTLADMSVKNCSFFYGSPKMYPLLQDKIEGIFFLQKVEKKNNCLRFNVFNFLFPLFKNDKKIFEKWLWYINIK